MTKEKYLTKIKKGPTRETHAPTNDQVQIFVEEKKYKTAKFFPMNKAQETEGF